MRVFFANVTKFCSVRHSVIGKNVLGGYGGIFVCRNLSQEFTHDFEDDHPETQEILRKLRQKHHYHGMTEQQKKIQDVMVIEPDFKWGRHRY